MKYDEYEKKIKKVASVKKIAYRFRILISAIAFVIVAISMTLFSTKGLITSQTKLNQVQYEYGQTIEFGATGFLTSDKNIRYEFSSTDGESWDESLPRHPGSYQIRPFSYNNYGQKCYGDIQSFTIVPKAVEVSIVSDEIDYGQKPEIKAELIQGDKISSYEIVYDDFSKEKPTASLNLSSLKIVDENDSDVSDCYSFSCEEKQITIKKRTLTIKMKDYSKIYDGNEVDLSECTDEVNGLMDGDKIIKLPECLDSFVDVGEYKYEGSNLKIENNDGIDVTAHYDVKFTKGNVNIKKRPLILKSDDISKVYDGKAADVGMLHIDGSTSLIDGDELLCESINKDLYQPCNDVENKFEYKIVNKATGKDNSKNYDISVTFGKINITKRTLTLDASLRDGLEALYYSDVKYGDTSNCIVFSYGELGENDTFEGDAEFVEDAEKHAYKINYIYKIMHKVEDVETDVTSCYDITFNDEVTSKIKKKEVVIKINGVFEKTYDGKPITAADLENNVSSTIRIPDKTSADEGIRCSFELNIPKYVTGGQQTKIVDTKLWKNGKDVTLEYDLQPVELKYEIKKKDVSVNIESKNKTYDGEVLSSTYSVYGLNDGDKIKITDKEDKFDLINKAENCESQKVSLNMKDAGTKSYTQNESDSENFIHHLSYAIFNSENEDVTSNYNVSINSPKFEIEKQKVSFIIPQMVHWYDGADFNYKEINDHVRDVEGLADNSRFKLDFSGTSAFNGNEYFGSSDDSSDEKYYDIRENVICRILDTSNNNQDVTENFQINMNFEAGEKSLVIKRVKISINLFSNSGSSIEEVPYGTNNELSFSNGSGNNFKIDNNNDYSDIQNYGYSPKNDNVIAAKLEGQNNGLEGYYRLSVNDFSFVPNEKLKGYGYKEISGDKIHLTLNGGEPIIKIRRRKLKFSLKSTTYWYNNKDVYDPSKMTIAEKDDNISDDPYAIISMTDGDGNEGLASGDKFVFSKKENIDLSKEGEYDFKDILDWKIVNNSGDDVTNNYTDGTEGYKSTDSSVLTGTLTIKVPTIALKKKENIQSIKYDGKQKPEIENLYEIDTNYNSDKYPSSLSNSEKNLLTTTLDNKNYTSGRVGTYEMDLVKVSFKWQGIEFSYDFEKEDSNYKPGIIISNIDDPDLFTYKIAIEKAKLTISMNESIDNWIYNGEEPNENSTNTYYYTYDGKSITLNEKVNKGEISIYHSLNIDGLAEGDEIRFSLKGKGLPSEAREDPYELNDYFEVHVFKKDNNEVTDCYDIDSDLGQLYIRKIKADIKVSLKNNTYYVGDEVAVSSSDLIVEKITSGNYPKDFKDKLKISLAQTEIKTDSEKNGSLSIKSIEYGDLKWTSSDNKYLDLTIDEESNLRYSVIKREIKIKDDIFEVVYNSNDTYTFTTTNATNIRDGETIQIQYKGKLNFGQNTIDSKKCTVTVTDSSRNDITDNLNISFENENLNVTINKIDLNLYIKINKSSISYGDSYGFEADLKQSTLNGSKNIKSIDISFASFNTNLTSGRYKFPKEDQIHVNSVTTTNDETYFLDALNVTIMNSNGTYTISKKNISVKDFGFIFISKTKLASVSESSIKKYIRENIIGNSNIVSGLVYGDGVESYDLDVNYNLFTCSFTYKITNIKIVNTAGMYVTSSCYNISYRVGSGMANYVPSSYSEDDFE